MKSEFNFFFIYKVKSLGDLDPRVSSWSEHVSKLKRYYRDTYELLTNKVITLSV